MSSWFADAWQAATEPTPEEQAAEEERRRQETLATQPSPSPVGTFLGQQFSQPDYGPATQQQSDASAFLANYGNGPSLGGIADYALNLPALNFIPGGSALSSGLGLAGVNQPTIGEAYNTDVPYYSDFARETLMPYAGDIGAAAGQIADPFGIGSAASSFLGGPSAEDVGRFGGQALVPVTAGDIVLNAALAGGPIEAVTGFPIDNILTGARGAADNIVRGAFPEPSLYPGLGAGIPPGGVPWDESLLGPIPSGLDNFQQGQPIFASNFTDVPTPIRPDVSRLPAEGMPGGIVDPNAFRISQTWAENLDNAPVNSLSDTEVKTALYNAGLDSSGSPAASRARYETASNAGVKLPLDQPPSDMPDAFDLARRGTTPQSPQSPQSPVNTPVTADEIQQAMERSRALEGGGLPAEATSSASPPPSSLTPGEITLNPEQAAAARDAEDAARAAYLNRGQNIDELIAAAKPPDTVPLVSDWPIEEQIAEAKRLGLPDISGDLTRGTELTRQQATDLLQARVDLDQAIRFGSSMDTATENVMRQNRELGFPSRVAGEGQTPAQREFLQSENGIASAAQREGNVSLPPGGGAAGGRMPSGGGAAQNPAVRLYNGIMEALYAPFGGDVSAPLRQLDVRTLNPLRAGETIQSMRVTAEAIRSQDNALRILEGQRQRIDDLGVKMDLSTWNGRIVDRETMTSKTLNAVPGYEALNRGYSTAINERRVLGLEDFAAHHPTATPVQLQTYANYMERVTGRGSFGQLENAASRLGPLFTSLRFAASWPQRVAYTLPWTRLADGSVEIAGPIWREAVKDHAGFIATGVATMALAQQAGLGVDWDRGDIIVGKQHINLWGGGSQYARAVLDVINGEKNGKPYPAFLQVQDDGTYKGTVAEFIRNKAGPLPEAAAAGLKQSGVDKALGIENEVKFLRPDYWDRGVTGKNLGIADRIGQYVVPLWVQDVAKAVMAESGPDNRITAEGVKAGALAGPLSFFGGGVQTWTNNTSALSQMRNDALEGSPFKYGDLLPHEQQQLNAALEKKYGADYTKAVQENQARLDPAIQQYQQARDTTYQQQNSDIDRVFKGLQDGSYDPRQARIAAKAIAEEYDQKLAALRQSPSYKEATKDFENGDSVARRTLDAYYAIPSLARGPDGNLDWDMVQAKRVELLATIAKSDPTLAQRIEKEVGASNANDHPYLRLLKDELPMINTYMSIKDTRERSALRTANPFDDAKLVYLGYEPYVLTPKAAEYLKALAPGQPANVGRR